MKRSIVPILCGYIDDDRKFKVAAIAGTGFLVDTQGRFVTPAHVLDGLGKLSKDRHACTPAIYIPDRGWKKFENKIDFQYFWFVACQTNTELDIAVCETAENPFTSTRLSPDNIAAVTFESAQVPDGTPVAFSGFPLELVSPVTSKANIAAMTTSFLYLLDKPVWGGDSGSPVYTDDGKVVGMATATGQQDATGLGVARTASVIVDFLSQHPSNKTQNNDKAK